jgi:hypothetical protein
MKKQICQGVPVVGSPTAGTATASYEESISNDSVTEIPLLDFSDYSMDMNVINRMLIKMKKSNSEFDINNLYDVATVINSDDAQAQHYDDRKRDVYGC